MTNEPTIPHRDPPVTKAPSSWLRFAALLWVASGVGYFAFTTFTGRDGQTVEKDSVPASARNSPGGYRSFHFWHGGYHGGK